MLRQRLHEEGLRRLAAPGKDCASMNESSGPPPSLTPSACSQILWVAGVSAYGSCAAALAPSYAAALTSARQHASFLLPVLLLLQNRSSPPTRLQLWAEARGVSI